MAKDKVIGYGNQQMQIKQVEDQQRAERAKKFEYARIETNKLIEKIGEADLFIIESVCSFLRAMLWLRKKNNSEGAISYKYASKDNSSSVKLLSAYETPKIIENDDQFPESEKITKTFYSRVF